MASTLIALLATVVGADPEVNGRQFGEIMKAAHAAIHDVSFLYEGETRWTGPPGVARVEVINRTFQGNYAFRSDGAMFIDGYIRRQSPKIPFERWTAGLLKGSLEERRWIPDEHGARAPIRRSEGNANSFNLSHSPHDFFYVPFFAAIPDPDAQGYVFRGWEFLGDRRCLVVELDLLPHLKKESKSRSWYKFWIDAERNAHPLRVESYHGTVRLGSVDLIKLALLPDSGGGKRVWFPVSGELSGSRWNEREYRDPVIRATETIVDGSVVLNQGLPDDYFSLSLKGDRSRTRVLRALRGHTEPLPLKAEFDEHLKAVPGAVKTDRKSVIDRLNTMLEEADQQAKMLEASAPTREGWLHAVLPPLCICLLGGFLVALAILKGWMRLGARS